MSGYRSGLSRLFLSGHLHTQRTLSRLPYSAERIGHCAFLMLGPRWALGTTGAPGEPPRASPSCAGTAPLFRDHRLAPLSFMPSVSTSFSFLLFGEAVLGERRIWHPHSISVRSERLLSL